MTNIGCLELFMAFMGFLLILLWLYYYWHQSRNSPILNWPLLGMSPGVLWNAHRMRDYATHCLKQCPTATLEFRGPCFANHNILLTSHPANVGPNFKKIFADTMGNGIFVADQSDSWASQRMSIQSLLKNGRFQKLFEKTIQEKVLKGLIPILEHVSVTGMEVDMQDLFTRFTFDNICMFVLGMDPGMLSIEFPEESYVTAFDETEEALLHRHILPQSCWRLQKWLQIGNERKLSRRIKVVEHFVFQCVSLKQ